MSQEVKTYTLEEFWELPEPKDGSKLELIDGILYMTPPPEPEHDESAKRINRVLTLELVRTNDKGSLYVPRAALWTGTNTFVEPDLFYLSEELKNKIGKNRRETADLVIEIISPSSEKYDSKEKPKIYEKLKVKELWIVNEKTKTVDVRIFTGKKFSDGLIFKDKDFIISKALPNIKIKVNQFFND